MGFPIDDVHRCSSRFRRTVRLAGAVGGDARATRSRRSRARGSSTSAPKSRRSCRSTSDSRLSADRRGTLALPAAQSVVAASPAAQNVVAASPAAQSGVAASPAAQSVVAAPPAAQSVVAASPAAQSVVAASPAAQGGIAVSAAARIADSNTTRTISVPGGVIELTVEERPKSIPEAALESWIERSARAVAAYYGHFPVERLDLAIRAGGSSGVSGGRTQGWGNRPRIRLFVADDATEKDLASDWQLVHEIVHLALPSLSGHAWLEEGIAVYVEPIVRARAGLQSKDEIWRWMLSGAPRGLEAVQTHGLDGSSGWAATYWGGTVYCLFADVGIRERTKGKKSLDDALRGIQGAGGDVTATGRSSACWTRETRRRGCRSCASSTRTGRTGRLRSTCRTCPPWAWRARAAATERSRTTTRRRSHRCARGSRREVTARMRRHPEERSDEGSPA